MKKIITMEEILQDVQSLAKQIRENYKVDAIYAVPRGGLVPGVFLSHLLNVPLLPNRDAVSTAQTVLVVDELIDTGATIKTLKTYNLQYAKHHQVCYIYTALYVRSTAPKDNWPDVFVKLIKNDDWLIFPWETKKEKPKSWGKKCHI